MATGVTPTHGGYTATRRGQEGLKQLSLRFLTLVENSPRYGTALMYQGTRNAPTDAMCRAAARAVGSALLIFRVPVCGGGRVEEQPEGWPARMPASLAPGQDALSTNPATRTRTFRAQPGRRLIRGPFSLALPPSRWLLSLGQARESDPASGRRSEARRRRTQSPPRLRRQPSEKSLDDQPFGC